MLVTAINCVADTPTNKDNHWYGTKKCIFMIDSLHVNLTALVTWIHEDEETPDLGPVCPLNVKHGHMALSPLRLCFVSG